MSLVGSHRFALEIRHTDGSAVGRIPVEPDWEPALECARFSGIRRGLLPARSGTPVGRIEPLWHARLGAPYVAALRAVVPGARGADAAHEAACGVAEITLDYLRPLIARAATDLVEAGRLRAGEQIFALVCASPATAAEQDGEPIALGFTVEELAPELDIGEAALASYLAAAQPVADELAEGCDIPVFLPHALLEEAEAAARQAPEVECGGVLAGRLLRDPEGCEVFLEVTAQIGVEHAIAGATRLTFTAETWSAARAALQRRDRGEQMVGWWHFHPDFCRACSPEKRRQCKMASTFFSAEDLHLHRALFGSAFAVALLLSDRGGLDIGASLFGWRRGVIVPRGFHLRSAPRASTAQQRPHGTTPGGENDGPHAAK